MDRSSSNLRSNLSSQPSKNWNSGNKYEKSLSNLGLFAELTRTLNKYGILSAVIDRLGIAFEDDSPRELVSLGGGLTSQIIRHSSDEDASHIVPSGSIVALKVFNCSSENDMATTSIPPVMALELGEYGSLEFIIRDATPGPTLTQKKHITLDIALGLRAIHRAGFTYGDLEPDNIVIISGYDFFCLFLCGYGDGLIHVTLLWSALEVLNRDPDTEWDKADVYSYGLVVASLWAREPGDIALEPAGQSTSCFLSWAQLACLDDLLREDVLFYLLDLLTPVLEPYFWRRSDTACLIQSLVQFGQEIGRDIE
ncbi:kinase-like protein [Xylaria grammica]|nr:kinase-like protein [Xylaria grammica]